MAYVPNLEDSFHSWTNNSALFASDFKTIMKHESYPFIGHTNLFTIWDVNWDGWQKVHQLCVGLIESRQGNLAPLEFGVHSQWENIEYFVCTLYGEVLYIWEQALAGVGCKNAYGKGCKVELRCAIWNEKL